jgi:very-short-patch-repair endonuclease
MEGGLRLSDPDSRQQQKQEFARSMRKDPTPAERILWPVVRNRRLAGYRFRRQHLFGPYILDFYCSVAQLVVELDGDTHVGREQQDRERDDYLRQNGLHILRIANGLVYEEEDEVLELIARTCAERAASNPKVQHKITSDGRFQFKPKE